MKHRYFLFAILLLMCVLIPLQEATATVTREVVNGTTRITDTDDTHNIVFTLSFTLEDGDKVSMSVTVLEDFEIISDPEFLNKSAAGTYKMEVTIPRKLFASEGTHTFTFLVVEGLKLDYF